MRYQDTIQWYFKNLKICNISRLQICKCLNLQNCKIKKFSIMHSNALNHNLFKLFQYINSFFSNLCSKSLHNIGRSPCWGNDDEIKISQNNEGFK
jgi:hypothetical protein